MTTLRVSRLHYPVTALGYGRRLGIWLQGCPLACPGCMARDTWAAEGGFAVDVDVVAGAVAERLVAGADGLTISGGEPLAQPQALAELLAAVDSLRASTGADDFDVLLYTGFELDELSQAQVGAARRADALVTGRYDVTLPTNLIWRGSANQVLRMQTPLGRRRYESYVDFEPAQAPIQMEASADGLLLVGVPRRDGLAAVERALRAAGADIRSVSWRRAPEGHRHAGGDPRA